MSAYLKQMSITKKLLPGIKVLFEPVLQLPEGE
jgi:hypothetical protein